MSEHTKHSHGPSQITIIQIIYLGGERTGVFRSVPGKEGEIGMNSVPSGFGGDWWREGLWVPFLARPSRIG